VRFTRALILLIAFSAAIAVTFFILNQPRSSVGDRITVYYTKLDGQTMGSYTVTLGTARDVKSVAFYAATQALAGPPPGVDAVRFPAGTFAHSVLVTGSTATVDLSGAVKNTGGGSFSENGEFKGLVWTMTALPGIHAVRIKVDGAPLVTLPGGHFELDEPLTRANW